MSRHPKDEGAGANVTRDDQALAANLKAGNVDALTALIKRYSTIVFGIARSILNDPAEAEEVVQQVFLETHNTIEQFDPEKGSFRAWLLKKTERRAIDQRRHLTTQGIYQWANIEDEVERPGNAGGRFLLSRQETECFVHSLLKVLDRRQRRVINLSFFNGLTLKEIEKETKETKSAVRKLFYGAIKQLRKAAQGRTEAAGANDPERAVPQKDGLDAEA